MVQTYSAPLRDMRFVLNELLDVGEIATLPGYEDATPDVIDAMIEEGAKLCENTLLPLNRPADEEGCHYENGVVRTPAGYKEAYKTFVDAGWTGVTLSPDYGGKGLPQLISMVFDEMVCSTNLAFGVYPLLTNGAAAVIELHAAEALKQAYLPRLGDGTWSGTMCLTEPHCGTDLGLIRTKAVPTDEGRYAISGTKIFISAGEHDLTENIVHLVLAKLPDAPPGVRGISLFLVPKRTLKEDGTAGPANGVSCGSIEEKMGIHGSATCVMHFDEAEGYLIGAPHKGLRCMFTMMNGARLGVGLQGPGAGRDRLSERDRLRQGPPPGARAQGRGGAGGVGRPHHRPPRRAPHAAQPARHQRGRPRARLLDRAAARHLAQPRGRLGARGCRRAGAADDADHQGLLHRLRLRGHQPRGAGARRPRLHPRARHGAAGARRADQPDLRGRERHPGARPGGPQAAPPRRALPAALLPPRRRLHRGEQGRPGARRTSWARWARRSASCRPRRWSSPSVAWAIPEEAGCCGLRLSQDVRAGGGRLHVVPDGEVRPRQAERRRLLRHQAQDRPLLRAEGLAGQRRALPQDHGGQGHRHGPRRRSSSETSLSRWIHVLEDARIKGHDDGGVLLSRVSAA